MNELEFTKEDILRNSYEMAKKMCIDYLLEVISVKDDFLCDTYMDMLEEEINIARELRNMLYREKYLSYTNASNKTIDRKLSRMMKKLESITK